MPQKADAAAGEGADLVGFLALSPAATLALRGKSNRPCALQSGSTLGARSGKDKINPCRRTEHRYELTSESFLAALKLVIVRILLADNASMSYAYSQIACITMWPKIAWMSSLNCISSTAAQTACVAFSLSRPPP